jgi:hypothetical protein
VPSLTRRERLVDECVAFLVCLFAQDQTLLRKA